MQTYCCYWSAKHYVPRNVVALPKYYILMGMHRMAFHLESNGPFHSVVHSGSNGVGHSLPAGMGCIDYITFHSCWNGMDHFQMASNRVTKFQVLHFEFTLVVPSLGLVKIYLVYFANVNLSS